VISPILHQKIYRQLTASLQPHAWIFARWQPTNGGFRLRPTRWRPESGSSWYKHVWK